MPRHAKQENASVEIPMDAKEMAEVAGLIEMRQHWLESTPVYNSQNFESREEHIASLKQLHAHIMAGRAKLALESDGREVAPIEFARKGGSKHKPEIRANRE